LNAHHTNKLSRGKGQVDGAAGRGSSALFDGARWQCSLGAERLELDDEDTRERLGEVVTFAITKSNYSRKADRVLLRRDLDNGGALVPLDETDLETVMAARGKDPEREARSAAREAEREQTRATRQRLADERRARETAAKVAEGETRRRAADRALVAVLRERPGITGDELRSALAARLDGCSRQRMQDTIARLGLAVATGTAPGKGHGTTHRLEEAALPEYLR
jgi:RecA-family ATPase